MVSQTVRQYFLSRLPSPVGKHILWECVSETCWKQQTSKEDMHWVWIKHCLSSESTTSMADVAYCTWQRRRRR